MSTVKDDGDTDNTVMPARSPALHAKVADAPVTEVPSVNVTVVVFPAGPVTFAGDGEYDADCPEMYSALIKAQR